MDFACVTLQSCDLNKNILMMLPKQLVITWSPKMARLYQVLPLLYCVVLPIMLLSISASQTAFFFNEAHPSDQPGLM